MIGFALLLVVLGAGCHDARHYWALTDVQAAIPEGTQYRQPRHRAGAPADWFAIRPGGGQTVLIACHEHDNPKKRDDERARTYIIVLDAPPAAGTIEVTPANSRYIETTAWLPPRYPYEGLEGKLTILSVKPNGEIVADCAIRNIIHHQNDPVRPLRGRFTFKPPAGRSVFCAARLGGSEE
jgi:hypothetical protein